MSEVFNILNSVLNVLSLVLVVFIVPLFKFLFELRLKIERIDVILNTILKDIEQLKKEVYDDGENGED